MRLSPSAINNASFIAAPFSCSGRVTTPHRPPCRVPTPKHVTGAPTNRSQLQNAADEPGVTTAPTSRRTTHYEEQVPSMARRRTATHPLCAHTLDLCATPRPILHTRRSCFVNSRECSKKTCRTSEPVGLSLSLFVCCLLFVVCCLLFVVFSLFFLSQV